MEFQINPFIFAEKTSEIMNMTRKDKEHYKRHNDEMALRSEIGKLIENFTRKYGLKAVNIDLFENEWYKGNPDDNIPIYNIFIAYKPTYME